MRKKQQWKNGTKNTTYQYVAETGEDVHPTDPTVKWPPAEWPNLGWAKPTDLGQRVVPLSHPKSFAWKWSPLDLLFINLRDGFQKFIPWSPVHGWAPGVCRSHLQSGNNCAWQRICCFRRRNQQINKTRNSTKTRENKTNTLRKQKVWKFTQQNKSLNEQNNYQIFQPWRLKGL